MKKLSNTKAELKKSIAYKKRVYISRIYTSRQNMYKFLTYLFER